MIIKNFLLSVSLTVLAAMIGINTPIASAESHKVSADKRRVVEHWTPARMAAAIPRDLVIDRRGLGYLRKPDGSLQPYGHSVATQVTEAPRGKPSNSSDSTPPDVSNMTPGEGAVIGTDQLFSATIKDASGIKSVSFVITYPTGATQSFNPTFIGEDTWEVNLQSFSAGDWKWRVVAKDGASRGGNTFTTEDINFSVSTDGSSGGGGSGGGTSYIVTNDEWSGGDVQTAAGRIYFEMPTNPKWKRWTGYVCSGTVTTDDTSGRSVIITAAHCVYDDANKAFARNVMFIPNQAETTTGSGTDTNCENDPLGCWVPSFGVVDTDWTTRTFPDNIEWDYAYYVVSDSGAHRGPAQSSESLDIAAGSLGVDFINAVTNDGDPSGTSSDFTHALGYSYSEDPNFMYCAEDMTIEGTVNWWLPSCALSGGSSGGPWVQPMGVEVGADLGRGPIISVNSWGYTTSPGMAGPKLVGTSAECLFDKAKTTVPFPPSVDGEAGIKVDSSLPCL